MRPFRFLAGLSIFSVTAFIVVACSSKDISINAQPQPETGPNPTPTPTPTNDSSPGTDSEVPDSGKCVFDDYTPPTPDGGTLKYDYTGWKMPDSYASFNIASYDTSKAGIVADKNLTRLRWQKGSAPSLKTYGEAVAYCNGTIAGENGWRLPTRLELASIIYWGPPSDAGHPSTCMGGDFDALPAGTQGYYWTSTPVAGAADVNWTMGFVGICGPSQSAITLTAEVRCVKDDVAYPRKVAKLQKSRNCPIVRDANAGIEWRTHTTPSTWTDLQTAKKDCVDLDDGSWRLPTMQELFTLVDTTRTGPALDTNLFSGAGRTMSETQIAPPGFNPVAAALNFDDGTVDAVSPNEKLPTRCMRTYNP